MLSNIRLKNLLKNAIEEFYSKDNELIAVKGMEQACVFRIGLYLYNLMQQDSTLSQFDLDCEYNKSNKGPKILDNAKVRPDLIIHKRNLNNDIPNISGAITGDESRYIDTGLHKINIEESDVVLVQSPLRSPTSEYQIVYTTDGSEKAKALTAAKFLAGNIYESTGADIAVVPYDGTQKCNIATKFIFIGCNEAFIEANLEMPKEDLGISGYYIKTLHNSCFIQAETSHGYQMGAICFSKYVLGYDYYTEDFATYNDIIRLKG